MNLSVSEIVKALSDSETATQLQARLSAFGVEGVDLTTLPARKASEEFVKAMSDLLIKPLGELSIEQIRALTALTGQVSEALEPTPKSVGYATKVNAHTFTYRVVGPTTDSSQESYIHGKLGADARHLIEGLKCIGVDVSVNVPILSEATLDTGSNYKTRTEQNRHYEGGLADPIQATIIAIEAICAAKTAGIELRSTNNESREVKGSRIRAEAIKAGLDEGTATVLEKLTTGLIRVGGVSGTGMLDVRDDGLLYALECYGLLGYQSSWAFGARPAPESSS